jgi:hypothetical protein
MKPRRVANYKIWKNALYKWDSYIKNRHRIKKICDPWSQKIIEHCEGSSVVFDSGGLFFKDFMPNITVVEVSSCPIKSVEGMLYSSQGVDFDKEFDNLILINPLSLKYNNSILDFLVNQRINRSGPSKPNLLKWVKNPGKIYLSVSDWHIYYDRLKYSVIDMVAMQLKELQTIGIECEYLEITSVNSDVENGNIKIILSTKHSII